MFTRKHGCKFTLTEPWKLTDTRWSDSQRTTEATPAAISAQTHGKAQKTSSVERDFRLTPDDICGRPACPTSLSIAERSCEIIPGGVAGLTRM